MQEDFSTKSEHSSVATYTMFTALKWRRISGAEYAHTGPTQQLEHDRIASPGLSSSISPLSCSLIQALDSLYILHYRNCERVDALH